MLDECGQDINISAGHVHACVYVFRGSKVAQVPTVSNPAKEQPHSHCRPTIGESTIVIHLEPMKIEEESIVLIVRHNYHHTSKQ